jgi:hypothetical protein
MTRSRLSQEVQYILERKRGVGGGRGRPMLFLIAGCGGRANAAPSTQKIRQPVAEEIRVIFNMK